MRGRARFIAATMIAVVALPSAAQAATERVDVRFTTLRPNVGPLPGLPAGTVVDAAFRNASRRGNIIRNGLKAVYLAMTPEERARETTTALFQWHRIGSRPGDEEPDSLTGQVTVKKNYLLTTATRQVKSYRGRWTVTEGAGLYGAVFGGGGGTVTGRDDCTVSGCRGYIRFRGTLTFGSGR